MGSNAISIEAREYEENSLRELRAAGYRITMPRVQVIRALADTDHALSAYAIHEKILNFNGKIDVVSVYRILSTLQEVGLIHHIGIVDGYFPSKVRGDRERRSAVIVSDQDQTVREVDLSSDIVSAIEAIAAKAGYAASEIKIEVKGSKTKGLPSK